MNSNPKPFRRDFRVDLSGRTIVVTGASSGIGAAVAETVAGFGAEVIGVDLVEPCQGVGRYFECDLSDPESIDRLVADLGDEQLYGLANVAGVAGSKPPEQVLAVNLLGVRHLTEALYGQITDPGAVVHVASTAGVNWRDRLDAIEELLAIDSHEAALDWIRQRGMAGPEAYDFSKEAVVVYGLSGAAEARRRYGIRVNVVSPGQIETPLLPAFYETMDRPLLDRMREAVGGDNGTPQHIADVVAFLFSDAAEWVSGADIWVDGGAEAAVALGRISS